MLDYIDILLGKEWNKDEEYVEFGVTRPSVHPYASHIVMFNKKDGF